MMVDVSMRKTVSVAGGHLRAAFTLIELLVVVSIIALLIALLLPALDHARESARTVSCLSQIRQLSIVLRFYLDEYEQWFPYGVDYGYSGAVWPGALQTYLQDTTVWQCPSHSQSIHRDSREVFAFEGWEAVDVVFYGGVAGGIEYWKSQFSYGYNMHGYNPGNFGSGLGERPFNPSTGGLDIRTHENDVRSPERMFAITDSNGNVVWDTVFAPFDRLTDHLAGTRHVNRSTNMLYVDGHADTRDSDWVNFRAGYKHWNRQGR